MNEMKKANPDAQTAIARSLAVVELRLYSMTTGMIRSITADRLMSMRVTRITLSFVMNTMFLSVDLREST